MTSPRHIIGGVLELGKDPIRSDRYVLSQLDLQVLHAALDMVMTLTTDEERARKRLVGIVAKFAHAPT